MGVIFLYGEMGVGKTTFIRYLINNLQEEKIYKLQKLPVQHLIY
jgi:tRNA A37 threonylcarbamoyladenosine biosynthesis protein TsaE